MRNLSEKVNESVIKAQTQVSTSLIKRGVRIFSFAAILTLMFVSVAFADNTSEAIQDGITDGSKQLYNIMTAVVLPIAAVFFAWNAFKALFGGERGMESAKKNMLTIVIVIALVYLAPLVITQISSWFSSSGGWQW